MSHRWINKVASSSNVILNTSISDVLKVVIMAAHVSSYVVLLQEWLELSHKGIRRTMLSN